MSPYGPKYDKQPVDADYDPLIDLQSSLGGPDEHNSILRVVRCLLLKIDARRAQDTQ